MRSPGCWFFPTQPVPVFSLRVDEQAIPTFYGNEIRHVNGVKYGFNVVKAAWLAWAQDLGVLYQRTIDLTQPWELANDQPKLTYISPNTLA
jgi:hypothetical protein